MRVVDIVSALVVEMMPLRVVEIVPAFVVEIVPALVVDIVPGLAMVAPDNVRTRIPAQTIDSCFFMVLLLVSLVRGNLVGSLVAC